MAAAVAKRYWHWVLTPLVSAEVTAQVVESVNPDGTVWHEMAWPTV